MAIFRSPLNTALAQHQLYKAQAQAMQAQQLAMQQAMYNGTSAQTSTYTNTPTSNMTWVTVPVGTMATSTSTIATGLMNSLYSSQGQAGHPMNSALVRDTLQLLGECEIADGEPCKIKLPDGGMLEVDADGSYRVNDKDAKVIYRANRVRDFNPFVNASDMLEGFIKFCGALGIRLFDMLNIPIKLFIGWLIIEAAMADGENKDSDIDLLEGIHSYRKPRCVGCGRFISRKIAARRITVCRPVCLERELEAA